MLNSIKSIPDRFLVLTRSNKRLIVVAVDLLLCVLSVWVSFCLRLGELFGHSAITEVPFLTTYVVAVGFALPIFMFSGLYRAIFRFNGLSALVTMTKAILIYGILFSAIFTLLGVEGVPRTIGLIQPIIMFLLVGASRAFARVLLGSSNKINIKRDVLPKVLIYGAGSAGRQLAQAMAVSNQMHIVGYLDDDMRLQGNVLNGLNIFNPNKIEELVRKKRITDVLLAMPSASRERRNQVITSLSKVKLVVRTLPRLSDIASGRLTYNDLQELDIYDLLGREPVKPNIDLLSLNTQKKTVLITGAGGSIGSELCRQLIRIQPRRLLLVEMSEFALYQIHQEILTVLVNAENSNNEEFEVVPLLASVCDEVRMHEIMSCWRPDTIYHTAAYKHVPLIEHNHSEGIHNNVWGTKVCAELAIRNGVQNFVLISTDKAVRPTNIMGATKRLAEMVLQALNDAQINTNLNTNVTHKNYVGVKRTCFTMVRFGNVLGSSGSVVPLFRRQVKNGGPITLTHSEITRYFMTIPEAAQLVIQAGSMGLGGDVFLLDMGEPVRIYDLATRIVELSGMTVRDIKNPQGDIEIKITGLRPGEKLFEELLIGDNPKTTQHPRILKADENFIPWDQLQEQLSELKLGLYANDVLLIRSILKRLVSGYQPNDEVVDWVYQEQKRNK